MNQINQMNASLLHSMSSLFDTFPQDMRGIVENIVEKEMVN